jgi:trehalose 2-sulfotransferase
LGLLESTGVAGHPQAYFRAPDEHLWAERWQIPRTPDDGFGYGDYVRAALTHGRTTNGVFGAKLMWGTLQEMLDKLRALSGDPRGDDVGLLTRTFGASRFVYVRRDDVVAQAVSWLRAEQTGAWYLGGNGEIGGTVPTGRAPAYDRERITDIVQTINEHNAGWEAWFASAGITPYRVRYEHLAADPAATTRDIVGFVGLRLPDGHRIAPRHRRQADDLNQQWADRYREHPAGLQDHRLKKRTGFRGTNRASPDRTGP